MLYDDESLMRLPTRPHTPGQKRSWFSRVLSREAMPGSQTNTSKSHFSECCHFFFLFQAQSLFRGDGFLEPGLNLQRNLFFFHHFQEADSLKGDLLARMGFFFWYFHEARELFTVRCGLGFDLFQEETKMDFFRFFCDERVFF